MLLYPVDIFIDLDLVGGWLAFLNRSLVSRKVADQGLFLDIVNDPENVLSNIFFSVYFISLA